MMDDDDDQINRGRPPCDLLFIFSSLLGSSFPRNPLTYQKGGFLEILFLGVGLSNSSMDSSVFLVTVAQR